jgi:Protein of unknown function, DUF400./Protein of unknown function (DUF1566).
MLVFVFPCLSFAETIDVHIKGVDDGARTTKQRDYKEAVLFAKREAIERAGVKIKSMTTVRDMVLNSDYIESKAEAVLLPGYNILDMGYSADGTYQVVLIGKVKTVSEGIDSKELRYAKSLMDRGEKAKAKRIITDIIENSKDNNAVAEAMYCQVLWKFASDERNTFEKLKAYYPNSKYTKRAENVLAEREAERKRIEAKREAERRRVEAKTGGRITDSDGRYFVSDNGIVFDTKTAREWFVGQRMKQGEALLWAENLSAGGGGWRLPTIKELNQLYQKGAGRNNMSPLLNNKYYDVWSSTKGGDYRGSGLCFFAFDERASYWTNYGMKGTMAVRSQGWERIQAKKEAKMREVEEERRREQAEIEAKQRKIEAETGRRIVGNYKQFFISDEGIVLDTTTGLEWSPRTSERPYTLSYEQAVAWIASLRVGGGGWRLPTVDELKTLKELYHSLTSIRELSSKVAGGWIWTAEFITKTQRSKLTTFPVVYDIKKDDRNYHVKWTQTVAVR